MTSRYNIEFYRFPDQNKNPEMYMKWLENVNENANVKFVPKKGNRVCSEHFSPHMVKEWMLSYIETICCAYSFPKFTDL